ncbi:hypothetical protein F5890DRAFT_1516510 [Lentinula detonsa]|uniref:Cupin type-2 domain-containing protein n=1 Tax=Lentinula detonsa TaxID=2804962 RepID=A0AA38PZ53_9AGAR|nr:hypothetical protein F5890DRAFT_1516510 [Lentinula detonsa]
MVDYPDTVSVSNGTTMTFKLQTRLVKIRGGPDDEVLQVPTHWHEHHDEIITVLEGQLKVTIGGKIKMCTSEDGGSFIPRGVPHALESLKGVPCVFTEQTRPDDFSDRKELFFRNTFAFPGGPMKAGLLPLLQVCHHGDTYFVFPIHFAWLEKAFVQILGRYIAPLLGYRLKYETLKKGS